MVNQVGGLCQLQGFLGNYRPIKCIFNGSNVQG